MASGDTLAVFTALDGEPPASNYATLDTRNNHPVLDFDTTTSETIYFRGVLPNNYAGGGLTIFLAWMATSATSGTIGWLVAIERLADGGTDLDADSFASANTLTAETVDAAAGVLDYGSVAFTSGAQMDSLAANEVYRISIARDVTNDTATGDAELVAVWIKET